MNNVQALLAGVRRRERIADVADGLVRVALPTGAVLAAVSVAAARWFDTPIAWAYLAVLPIPLVLIWALFRPRSLRASARRVDTFYALHDRIGSAVELSPATFTDARQRAWVELLQRDADTLAATLDPRPVIPVRLQGFRRFDALALILLGVALLLPPRSSSDETPASLAPEREPTASTVMQRRIDLTLARPLVEDLRGLQKDRDAAAAIAAAMLDVLEDLEAGRTDRERALARLEQLEQRLAEAERAFDESLAEDPALLAEAARALASALERQTLTEDVAHALANGKADAAETAMERAADAAQGDADDARELQRALRDAERSLNELQGDTKQTAKQLHDAERRLQRQQDAPARDPAEQERRLSRARERVEQLRRQHEREQKARERIEQLRRQSAAARDGSSSAAARKDAARQVGRNAGNMARSGQQRRRLGQARDDLEEAKSFIRRADERGGEENQRRRQQAMRFSDAAKGRKPGKDGPSLLVEGDVGDGQQPSGVIEGDDAGGQEQSGAPSDAGADAEPGDDGGGDGQSDAQGQAGQDGSDRGASDSAAGGAGMGRGSVDNLGNAAGEDLRTRDIKVSAREGHGVSRAEIIRTSSQSGFATEPYRDMYQDYRAFAQSTLDNEQLPTAKRRVVKRYFQLIQPRR